MATDIWIHVEYKSRKTGRWTYAYEADGDRNYNLFSVLAGTRGECLPLYDPRGLPDDISDKAKKKYEDWGTDAHTPSWLTTQEFKECLSTTIKRSEDSYRDEMKKWLEPYYEIYEKMYTIESQGELCRMIFWFDN
jgi:hypothetical protein